MISPNNEREIKRQEISPGIFIEKFQEKVKETSFYVINVEIKIFQLLDFTVDFSGSQNVDLQGSETLIKETILPPFSKIEVARLVLSKKWNLKTKFKFALNMPSIIVQKDHLFVYLEKLKREMLKCSELQGVDLSRIQNDKIKSQLSNLKTEFVDLNFPPADRSLVNSHEKVEDKFECMVHWKRGRDTNAVEGFGEDLWPIFVEQPTSASVKNGKLNDGAVISAIAALAENPKLAERIFLTKSANETGLYKLKLAHNGRWNTLVLDEYFPCFPLGKTMFSKSEKDEIWVQLIEKAFAKKFEGYSHLIHVNFEDALVDLTNCPVFKLDLEKLSQENAQEIDFLWQKINEWKKKQFILSADIRQFLNSPEDLSTIKNFTYSIIGMVEISHKEYPLTDGKESGVSRLLNLRNLWSLFEWTGDWSPDSILWTDEIIRDFDIDLDKQGKTFWISVDNFLENFSKLHVAKTQKWNELRIKGKLVHGVDQNNPKISHFCSRWFYQFEVVKTTHVVFGMHQEDQKIPSIGKTRPFVDIGLALMKVVGETYELVDYHDTDFVRQDFLEAILEPGVYVVLPRSVGVCLSFDNHQKDLSEFNRNDLAFVSVVEDIFEKYDLLMNGYLTFDELSGFYTFIGRNLSEQEYHKILKHNKTAELLETELLGITKFDFVGLFYHIIEKLTLWEIQSIFEKLGYKPNLFSHRTRLFTLSLHSDVYLNLTVKDALVDNIDFGFLRILLAKFGSNINEPTGMSGNDVQGVFYFNKLSN